MKVEEQVLRVFEKTQDPIEARDIVSIMTTFFDGSSIPSERRVINACNRLCESGDLVKIAKYGVTKYRLATGADGPVKRYPGSLLTEAAKRYKSDLLSAKKAIVKGIERGTVAETVEIVVGGEVIEGEPNYCLRVIADRLDRISAVLKGT